MTHRKESHSDLPIPPGEYLEEVLCESGMTQDELSRRMNCRVSILNAIFTGAEAITPNMARRLEKAIGVPAHIWTGLETEYQSTLNRLP